MLFLYNYYIKELKKKIIEKDNIEMIKNVITNISNKVFY